MINKLFIKNIFFYFFIFFCIICNTILEFLSLSFLFFFHTISIGILYFTYVYQKKQLDIETNNKIIMILLLFFLQGIISLFYINDETDTLIVFIYFFCFIIYYLFIIYFLLKSKPIYISNQLTSNEKNKIKNITFLLTSLIYIFTWFLIIICNFLILPYIYSTNISIYTYFPIPIVIILILYLIHKWNLKFFNQSFNKKIIITFILFFFHFPFIYFLHYLLKHFTLNYFINNVFFPINLILPFIYLFILIIYLITYKKID